LNKPIDDTDQFIYNNDYRKRSSGIDDIEKSPEVQRPHTAGMVGVARHRKTKSAYHGGQARVVSGGELRMR